jgi:hypothetical protein
VGSLAGLIEPSFDGRTAEHWISSPVTGWRQHLAASAVI